LVGIDVLFFCHESDGGAVSVCSVDVRAEKKAILGRIILLLNGQNIRACFAFLSSINSIFLSAGLLRSFS
jgi:hypothetical protein